MGIVVACSGDAPYGIYGNYDRLNCQVGDRIVSKVLQKPGKFRIFISQNGPECDRQIYH
ncbi:MAG: hypothetical protein HC789_23820 [Microcoleus sp. CSU_2_2]|nr:hypothetical protein [Microcoleus sp. SU_5_3]NJS13181.1 hypothetical protein [Microcoleus sp. CSU_2_2]